MATAAGAEDGKRSFARSSRQQVEQSKARIVELMTEVARKKNQISYIERQREEITGQLKRLDEKSADGASEAKEAEQAVEASRLALEASQVARAKATEDFARLQAELAESRSAAGEIRSRFDEVESERSFMPIPSIFLIG